jgi:NADH dehydrogenase FAD-containing subunit
VTKFLPEENRLVVGNGDVIHYDYLVVGVGLQLR